MYAWNDMCPLLFLPSSFSCSKERARLSSRAKRAERARSEGSAFGTEKQIPRFARDDMLARGLYKKGRGKRPRGSRMQPGTSHGQQHGERDEGFARACEVDRTGNDRPQVDGQTDEDEPKSTSVAGDFENGVCECLRCLLRQVVPYPTRDEPVRIPAGELFRIRAGIRMRRAVGISFQRNRGDADSGGRGEPLLQFVELRLAGGEAEAPAIVVDHDGHVIGIVKSRGAAIECRIIEIPFRRRELPNKL